MLFPENLAFFVKYFAYITPRKKWIVWTSARWETDNGSLIHDKGLSMIRNIYAELCKTADYRNRFDIKKYAIRSESVRRREAFVKAVNRIPCFNAATGDLDQNQPLTRSGQGQPVNGGKGSTGRTSFYGSV